MKPNLAQSSVLTVISIASAFVLLIGGGTSASAVVAHRPPVARRPAPPAKPKVNPYAVNSDNVIAAIKRGVAYLLSQENLHTNAKKPFWETGFVVGAYQVLNKHATSPKNRFINVPVHQYGGETALVVEALLDVEQSLHLRQISQFAPAMAKPIKFLTRLNPPSTYSASFQANAMTLLPNKPVYRQTLMRDFRYLLTEIHRDGAYHYGLPESVLPNPSMPGNWDNSNTQYGVLGAWACAHQGIKVPFKYWELAASHWRKKQWPNGSWVYGGFKGFKPPPKIYSGASANTFTAAGVASLLICDEFMLAKPTARPVVDENVLRGLKWMNAHFPQYVNTMTLYSMYGYERVALASGLQQFGGIDWYRALAARLLAMAHGGGRWGFQGFNVGTAYALLILDRGLNPVIMSKLQYTKDYFGPWNARQRDAANFVSWVTHTFETPVNWQVVSINAPMSQWLDSPILFITGDRDPKFTKQQVLQLTTYVDNGGIVFCSGEGQSQSFKRAMLRYGQEVVHNQYEAHVLSRKSYLYTMQPWYHPTSYGQYMGISNGIRYVWVIANNDVGAQWQAKRFTNRDAFELPANLYLYAIGNGAPADRLQSLFVPPSQGKMQRALCINRLVYPGNWNPEPGAWPRMGRLAGHKFSTGVTFSYMPASRLGVAKAPLTTLTGTRNFQLPPAQVQALRKYLSAGGMLFADAAGGKPQFGDGIHTLVRQLYPKAALQNIPLTDPLITGKFAGGVSIATVQYRKFYLTAYGLKKTPQLLGVKQGNRWVIVFSPWDVTSGLLGTNTWGIAGYAPKSAQAIARNVMLYALAHKP
ncbi:MAG: DUF4159 domain-containing protein [Phycisphaerales bacterium]|nr:DUF4159 domain-containing protein [Phycisphaerales bacterium]